MAGDVAMTITRWGVIRACGSKPGLEVEHERNVSRNDKQSPAPRQRATRLTLLCRGATMANRQARLSPDDPLLHGELEKAATLARSLRPFDTVLHAPETGALETAKAFSNAPISCEALADIDYGRWTGETITAIAEHSPDDFQRWMADPAAAPHGGEAFDTAAARAVSWLETLHGAGGNVLAVTHGMILKLLLAHVLSAPRTSVWRIDVEPLGMLRLSSDGNRWALRGFGGAVPQPADA